MGAIFHPALTLLNAGWIESTKGNFQFYIDGVTPSTARVLEVLDRERVTIAAALGIRATTALEWLKMAYDAKSADGAAGAAASPPEKPQRRSLRSVIKHSPENEGAEQVKPHGYP